MTATEISNALLAPRACSCPRALVPVLQRFLFLHLAHRAGCRDAAPLLQSRGKLTGHSLKPRVASVGVTILWLRTLPPPPSTPINGGHADPLGENVVATWKYRSKRNPPPGGGPIRLPAKAAVIPLRRRTSRSNDTTPPWAITFGAGNVSQLILHYSDFDLSCAQCSGFAGIFVVPMAIPLDLKDEHDDLLHSPHPRHGGAAKLLAACARRQHPDRLCECP